MTSRWNLLKRFGRAYIRPLAFKFGVTQVLHVVATGLMLAPPLIVREVLNKAVNGADYSLLWILAGAIVAIGAAFFGVCAWKEYWGHEVAQRITSRLRNDLYGHFQKLSMSFHDRKKPGGLLARLVDDINIIQEATHHGPEAIIYALVTAAGTVGIMFYLDWQLALVAVCAVPVLAVYTNIMAGRMWNHFRDVRRRKEYLSDLLEENLTGIHIIKSFASEHREMENVERENRSHYQSRMRVIKYISTIFPGAMMINRIGMAAVILFGGYRTIAGAVSVGDLVAFIMLLGMFMHPLVRIVIMMEQAGRFFAGIERFFDYMDLEPDIRDRPDAMELTEVEGHVRFDNVHFKYDQEPILRGISFTVEPGQMIALVGPSGAGKTTITRLIPRFYEPQQGRVLIDGRDIRSVKIRDLRHHMGMVMQDDFLFSGTVAENIGYGRPEATRDDIIHAAGQANAAEFIEQMPDGYDTEIGKRGVKLSEGQRQRISIARALLKDPRILILDEATSSVDTETELLIKNALERLRRGRTTFAIAHRLSTIFQADNILFIDNGQIVESGTHRRLIQAGGQYARYFDLQFKDLEASRT